MNQRNITTYKSWVAEILMKRIKMRKLTDALWLGRIPAQDILNGAVAFVLSVSVPPFIRPETEQRNGNWTSKQIWVDEYKMYFPGSITIWAELIQKHFEEVSFVKNNRSSWRFMVRGTLKLLILITVNEPVMRLFHLHDSILQTSDWDFTETAAGMFVPVVRVEHFLNKQY